jgi:hypothetical protein
MKLRLTRRLVAVSAVLAVAVAIGGTALAGHLGEVKSYTGCLVPKDGVIIKVKEGTAPASPCTAGMMQVHLSGGDITKISVTGALTGGGDNGEVTLGLKPEFTLPQNCTAPNNLAKWNGSAWACAADNDTTYTAGTALDLSAGNEFSIEPAYRVRNTPDCSSGRFATGFDSNGEIQCAAPQPAALPWLQASGGGAVLDDGDFHAFASVSPAAGTYLVIAKGTISSEQNVDQFKNVQCRIENGGVEFDRVFLDDNHLNNSYKTPFSLTAIRAVISGTLDLACRAGDGADGIALADGRITAVRLE